VLGNRSLHEVEMLAIRILKAKRLRWAGNAARMREKRYAYSDLVRKRREDTTGEI
jgi:hypothetical protein